MHIWHYNRQITVAKGTDKTSIPHFKHQTTLLSWITRPRLSFGCICINASTCAIYALFFPWSSPQTCPFVWLFRWGSQWHVSSNSQLKVSGSVATRAVRDCLICLHRVVFRGRNGGFLHPPPHPPTHPINKSHPPKKKKKKKKTNWEEWG